MSDLGSLTGFKPAQPYTTLQLPREPILLDTAAPWLLSPPSSQAVTEIRGEKTSQHRRHKHKKHSKKKSRKQQLGGYILQLIGLVCLVLAAVKAFEPLTGVGFTLVMVGYKGAVRDDGAERKSRRKTKKRIEKGALEKEGADDK